MLQGYEKFVKTPNINLGNFVRLAENELLMTEKVTTERFQSQSGNYSGSELKMSLVLKIFSSTKRIYQLITKFHTTDKGFIARRKATLH